MMYHKTGEEIGELVERTRLAALEESAVIANGCGDGVTAQAIRDRKGKPTPEHDAVRVLREVWNRLALDENFDHGDVVSFLEDELPKFGIDTETE